MTVENKQDAVTAEVKKDEVVASTTGETGVDLAEELVKALEREQQVIAERDNYKRGMLKAKGKLKDDEDDNDEEEDETVVVKQKAKAKTDSSTTELVGLVKQVLKDNQELKTAIANKAQIGTAGAGAGTTTTLTVGDNVLSADQITSLKAKGWDDTKIARFKQNLLSSRA